MYIVEIGRMFNIVNAESETFMFGVGKFTFSACGGINISDCSFFLFIIVLFFRVIMRFFAGSAMSENSPDR